MNDTIMGRIGCRVKSSYEFDQPWRELTKGLEGFSTANLADGMKGFYCMDMGIRPMVPGAKMLGPALTVKLRPGDNLMLHKATELVKDGYIVVCDTQGCTSYALLGELMASALKKQNAGGIVIDGVIRDCEEVIEVGLPVYARGAVSCAGDKEGPGEINVPVCCGGVVVRPGDFIAADASGVVVIPREDVADVAAGAKKKTDYEEVRRQEIADGNIVKDNINRILSAKCV